MNNMQPAGQYTPEMGQTQTDLFKLLHEAAVEAAAAREAGDMDMYRQWSERRELLARIYRGVGSTEDLLEIERTTQGPLEQIGNIASAGALAIAALVAFMLLKK